MHYTGLKSLLLLWFTHTRTPRDHRPVNGGQYSRHDWGFTTSDGGNNSTRHHDTSAQHEDDPWCVRRMWVPPAQEHQGEEFAVALLTDCQQTNLCDEVNPGNRHVYRYTTLQKFRPPEKFSKCFLFAFMMATQVLGILSTDFLSFSGCNCSHALLRHSHKWALLVEHSFRTSLSSFYHNNSIGLASGVWGGQSMNLSTPLSSFDF